MLSISEQLLRLRQVPIFREMTYGQLERLASRLEIQSLGPGEVVYEEGDSSQYLYILIRGVIRVVKAYGEPTERELALLKPGDFFGEMGIFEGKSHAATLIAREPACVFLLSAETFKYLITQHPSIAFEIGRELSARLRRMTRAGQIDQS